MLGFNEGKEALVIARLRPARAAECSHCAAAGHAGEGGQGDAGEAQGGQHEYGEQAVAARALEDKRRYMSREQ